MSEPKRVKVKDYLLGSEPMKPQPDTVYYIEDSTTEHGWRKCSGKQAEALYAMCSGLAAVEHVRAMWKMAKDGLTEPCWGPDLDGYDLRYRYDYYDYGGGILLYIFKVVRATKYGVWIDTSDHHTNLNKRFVLNGNGKRFAYPDKARAWQSFRYRKLSEAKILAHRMELNRQAQEAMDTYKDAPDIAQLEEDRIEYFEEQRDHWLNVSFASATY